MPKNGQFYKVSIFPPRDPKIVYIKRVEGGGVQVGTKFDPPSHTQLNFSIYDPFNSDDRHQTNLGRIQRMGKL